MADDLGSQIAGHLLPSPPPALGIAVSGGGDSIALLHLLHDFASARAVQLHAVTVNHGLRSEAADEAAAVARHCADLQVPHKTLRWTGWDHRGNLQKAAREARYGLITRWAQDNRLQTVALGHTLDDQAETVLMRLARGAGVDGLTGMTPRRLSDGITWLRPLLGAARADLRAYLRARDVAWCDDPSNEDDRFDRIRMRKALEVLAPLGIDAHALGQVAFNMARARDALSWQAFLEARRLAQTDAGAVRMDWRVYRTLPDETARRILLSAMGWISGSDYVPRRRPVLSLIETLKEGTGGTVDGCRAWRTRDTLWVAREYQPVRDLTCCMSELWDGRWRVQGGLTQANLHIAALGSAGLAQLPEWRKSGRPSEILQVTPGVWRGPELVAAPAAGYGNGWRASVEGGDEALFAALLSH